MRICFGDHDRELALAAEYTDPATGERNIIAVGRMNRLHAGNAAEVADNVGMQLIFRRNGFLIRAGEDITSVAAHLDL